VAGSCERCLELQKEKEELLEQLDECQSLLSEKVSKILELEREIEGVYEDAAGVDL